MMSLRDKIRLETAERKARYAEYEALYKRACDEGMAAGKAAIPIPMTVVEPSNVMDPNSPPRNEWFVPEGPCGFAEVVIHPATSSFARWLAKNNLASTRYNGGMSIWIGAHNQSVTRKEAHAYKMAEIFKAAGIKCFVSARLD